MPDDLFVQAVHTANDAGFTINTALLHTTPAAKRAGLRGDIYEVVIRRRLEVFWIGQSLNREEIQGLAAEQIQAFVRDYSNDTPVK